MNIYVLNKEYQAISIVDAYESFIWTNRYYGYGDFEIYAPITPALLENLKQDYYLVRKETDRVMIIEKSLVNSDVENGDHITVTGRSLESILDRRIVWVQTTLTGNFQDGIERLLNENAINPSKAERKIPGLVFKKSTDPVITALKIDAQYTGDNLYDVIVSLCEERHIGFKITLDPIAKQMIFELYAGVDRSYDQTERPYVVFAPNFDNVISSNYMEDRTPLKNVALIGGEGEGAARKYAAVGNYSGLERRELFVDARDISSDVDDKTLTDEEYSALLTQRGKEKLTENTDIKSFEGEMEVSIMYVYGRDFFDGDIVQMADEYGHNTRVRVLEVVTSESEEGISVYPTFKTFNQEGEEVRT